MLTLERQQLIDGIERLALNARAAIYLIGRNDSICYGIHAAGALIAVGNRIAEHVVFGVEQHEVNRPGIDAHGFGRIACFFAFSQAGNGFAEQHIHVPAVVTAGAFLDVVEAMDLGKLDGALRGNLADYHAAGRSADIDGGIAVGFDFH